MNFPPVPENEPLGPPRRIEGSYTLAKKLILAPVQVGCKEGLEETLVLGQDGGFYRGKEKYASQTELSRQLRGTKKPVIKRRQASSSRGFVEPTVISLQTESKLTSYGNDENCLIKLPVADLGKIVELIKKRNTARGKIHEPTKEDVTKSKQAQEEKSEEDKLTEESEQSEQAKEKESKPTEEAEESEGAEEAAEGAEGDEEAAEGAEGDEEAAEGAEEDEEAAEGAEEDEEAAEGAEEDEEAAESAEEDEEGAKQVEFEGVTEAEESEGAKQTEESEGDLSEESP